MTNDDQALHCFLYHSHIAPQAAVDCVADIVKTARSFNKTQGITGLLVFDGQRFCQYIEGPQPALRNLIASIARDPRHTTFTPLYEHPCEHGRKFATWAMAYVLVDDVEPLASISTAQGPSALNKLQELLPLMDIA